MLGCLGLRLVFIAFVFAFGLAPLAAAALGSGPRGRVAVAGCTMQPAAALCQPVRAEPARALRDVRCVALLRFGSAAKICRQQAAANPHQAGIELRSQTLAGDVLAS